MKKFALCGSAVILGMLAGCQWQDVVDSGKKVAAITSFGNAPSTTTSFGCQSRSSRTPWGVVDVRTWTPRLASVPANPQSVAGSAYGAPFSARLVEAYGFDYGESRRTVILELADGCRRSFAAKSFSDDDLAVIKVEADKHPTAPDPATYQIKYSTPHAGTDPLTSPELVASGALNLYQTQHFAFWYGNGNDNSYDFHRTINAQGRTMKQVLEETAEWYERIWLMNRDVLGAPMPFANERDKYKLNIYLCGTGRPNAEGDRDDCGAGAGEEQGISAWALLKGSKVVAHEFGHMVQFYTRGFWERPEAGPIWETGAEWSSYMLSPGSAALGWYLNNLESGPTFSVSRYGATPFMAFLFETDRTRSLVFDAWRTTMPRGA